MYSRHAGMSRAGSPHDAASICLVILLYIGLCASIRMHVLIKHDSK